MRWKSHFSQMRSPISPTHFYQKRAATGPSIWKQEFKALKVLESFCFSKKFQCQLVRSQFPTEISVSASLLEHPENDKETTLSF